MHTLINLKKLRILKYPTNLNKFLVDFTSYTDIVVNNRKSSVSFYNSRNVCNDVNTVKSKCNESVVLKKNTQLKKYRRENTLSVSIIGGGYNAAYTSILLKQNPAIKDIRLIDMNNSLVGPTCDIKCIDTCTIIKHYHKNCILDGLRNTDIVALMDEAHISMPSKGVLSQFKISCDYVRSVTECMINACPRALIAVFARPVTATLPLVVEMYRNSGDWNPNKIIGSAALESMRISAMAATFLDLNSSLLTVPIVGGVDSLTLVPIFSKTRPTSIFNPEDQAMLYYQLRSADQHLNQGKATGSLLSGSMAAANFISTLIDGLKGQSSSATNAYVRSDILPSCKYMTSELQFGPNGIQKNLGLPKMSAVEINMIEQAVQIINKIVDKVVTFVNTGKIN